MRKTQKIALSGIMAALSSAVMLAAYFPYLTFTAPAVAGVIIMIAFLECGSAFGFGAYIVSGILSLILCEKEAAVLYICVFGAYPMIKAYIEKIKNRLFEWILKLLFFNLSGVVYCLLCIFVLGMPVSEFTSIGRVFAVFGIAIYNLCAAVYDLCLSKLAARYCQKYRAAIKKIFYK